MRNIFSLVFIALLPILGLVACSESQYNGNGHIVSQTRQVKPFNQIVLVGNINVLASTGRKLSKISIITDSNLLPYIETNVKNEILYIQPKKNVRVHFSRTPAINLRADTLKTIKITGQVRFKLTNLVGSNLNLELKGNSRAELRGQVTNLKVHCLGQVNLNAVQLHAKNVTLIVDGKGLVKVNAKEHLRIKVFGPAIVEYTGNPTLTQIVSGGGKIFPIMRK